MAGNNKKCPKKGNKRRNINGSQQKNFKSTTPKKDLSSSATEETPARPRRPRYVLR